MQRQDLHANRYTPRQVPCGKNVLRKREKLEVPFNFRLTASMADAAREKAAALGKDVSQYLRDVLAASLRDHSPCAMPEPGPTRRARAAAPIGGGYAFADSEELAA